MRSRSALLRHTLALALATGLSRILGFVREMLLVRYLGVGMAADAFLTALRIPYSLRKIFAEGALTAALVPSLVASNETKGKAFSSEIVTTVMLIVGLLVSGVALGIAGIAPTMVHLLVPGWQDPFQIRMTSKLLQILIPSVISFSLMASAAGALHAAGRFRFASFGQAIQNTTMILALGAALYWKLSLESVALLTMLGIAATASLTLWAYSRVYSWRMATPQARAETGAVLKKFLPCIITLGALELNIFIDQIFASYLPAGSVSLLYYTQAFVRLPLGIVIAAFATVLLPTLARVAVRTPRRLAFHLYEALKLVIWVTIPSVIAMAILGYPAFSTLMVSDRFSFEQAAVAAKLLCLFACGVPFFAANRIIIAIYHARHDTLVPTVVTLATTMINTLCNAILIQPFGIYGLVSATVGTEILKTIILLSGVHRLYQVRLPTRRLMEYTGRAFLVALSCAAGAVLCAVGMHAFLVSRGVLFLAERWGVWIWVLPLCGASAAAYYAVRRITGCRAYFLGD
jgi:putative peptidoglycan lipid II flippase